LLLLLLRIKFFNYFGFHGESIAKAIDQIKKIKGLEAYFTGIILIKRKDT